MVKEESKLDQFTENDYRNGEGTQDFTNIITCSTHTQTSVPKRMTCINCYSLIHYCCKINNVLIENEKVKVEKVDNGS